VKPSAEVQRLLEEVEATRGAPYAEATRQTLRATLRRYITVLRDAGVPVRFDRRGLEAYCEHVYDRFEAGGLAAASAHAYISQLAPFVAEKDVQADLQALCRYSDVAKRRGTKRKARKLAANPRALVDFMRVAVDLLDAAPRQPIARSRHAYYNLAGLVALLVFLPLRRADARTLRVGIHVLRSTVGWSVRDIQTQKTGVEVEWVDLPDFLNEFLDGALLQGADGRHLWTAYDRRRGQALFASSPEGGPYEPAHLSTLFAKHTGFGPHILRTLMTTYLVMTDHDRLVIQAMLQHRNLTSQEAYDAPARQVRRQQAMDAVVRIEEEALGGH
jgi:integrase